jgi:hypothetical protein
MERFRSNWCPAPKTGVPAGPWSFLGNEFRVLQRSAVIGPRWEEKR